MKADATRFSETGYVGANVDDLIRELVTQADDTLELAQYGIIYLDEADQNRDTPEYHRTRCQRTRRANWTPQTDGGNGS